MNINAVCSCGKDMTVEVTNDFVRLICGCGQHKMIRMPKLGPKDTQPIPVIAKSMSEDEIHAARMRLMVEMAK